MVELQKIIPKRLWLTLVCLALLGGSTVWGEPTSAGWAAWHWPVPAGEWLVSRGPCNAATPYDHNCRYYEESCAVDIIPRTGSMEGVPVLAPYRGTVFFVGLRDDGGQTLMLLHPDGRVSGFMHLARIVVGLDAAVTQGEVLAYAGNTGSSGKAHLHFFVQPNAVLRECLPLDGLDTADYRFSKLTSRNLPWEQLALGHPLQATLNHAPPLIIASGATLINSRLTLAPQQTLSLTLAFANTLTQVLITTTNTTGSKQWPLFAHRAPTQTAVSLVYTVAVPLTTTPASGLLLLNPQFITPTNYIRSALTPRLCWAMPRQAGVAPLSYRVMVVGPSFADSGWLSGAQCWQPPALTSGIYYWKVFARDALGQMNRTNQRPAAFSIR